MYRYTPRGVCSRAIDIDLDGDKVARVEFVGGCDIVTEMTLSGELDKLFEEKGVAFDRDAAEKIRAANA